MISEPTNRPARRRRRSSFDSAQLTLPLAKPRSAPKPVIAQVERQGSPSARMSTPAANGVEPLSVKVTDAIRIAGFGRTKLYELVASGELEMIKIGRRTLIPMDSLRAVIERGRAR